MQFARSPSLSSDHDRRDPEILAWEKQKEVERDTGFVELGRYLCEVRACRFLNKGWQFLSFIANRVCFQWLSPVAASALSITYWTEALLPGCPCVPVLLVINL